MPTLMQLRRMVRNRLGVDPTDQFFRDDLIDDAINNAIVTFESERNWDWQLRIVSITTTDETGIITLPADWKATRDITVAQQDALQYLAPYELMRWNDAVASPQVFSHIGNELHVRPLAPVGTVLKLCYYRTATLLTDDQDSPDLPTNAYPLVVAKAAQLCSVREDDRPSAESHLLEYAQWVQRMTVSSENHTRPVGRRIRPGAWT